MHGEMLIDGHFIGGPCDQSVGKAVQRSPYDGSIVGTAAEGTFLELRAAISAAHDAFPSWSGTTAESRQSLLRNIAQKVKEQSNELAQLLVDEIGKPITLAKGEVARLAVTFELAAEALNDWAPKPLDLGPDQRAESYQCQVTRVPRGVVFGIAPYNWPFNLAAHKIAPALATGNTLVLKPSPQALLSTYALARLIHEAGCPPGVFNVVGAPPKDVAHALQDPRIKLVSFTGSEAVGWQIKQSLPPETLCILELGGDASAIVMSDANLEEAAQKLAFGSFAYAGQICISVQHIWAEDSVYERFQEAFIKQAEDCPAGDPHQPETICGPLISAKAADKVEAMINEAMSLGAKRWVGGKREGNLLFPTVLAHVPPEAKVFTEEVFGPVVLLHRFTKLSEAIATINQSRFGIQAGIFTNDQESIQEAFQKIEVGGLIVNDPPTTRFDAYPYGGVKRSGIGREGVHEAMNACTEPKTLLIRH